MNFDKQNLTHSYPSLKWTASIGYNEMIAHLKNVYQYLDFWPNNSAVVSIYERWLKIP